MARTKKTGARISTGDGSGGGSGGGKKRKHNDGSGAGGGSGSGEGGSSTSVPAFVPQPEDYYEWQMFYEVADEVVHFPGDGLGNVALRHSPRVEELPSLQQEDFRIVPTNPFVITNFRNWHQPANPHLNLEDGGVVQHPTDWERVNNLQEWRALDIGTALFVRYHGPQNDGWEHGWYLVHKR